MFLLLPIYGITDASAQDSLANRALKISGYAEVYYAFDLNKPSDNQRPDFLYSFNRHNEVNLNLGMVKVGYETEKVRGNFALMAGTYANANLATEPGVLKHIHEANIGVKLSKHRDVWIDAGIMPSHIGFESAIGADTWNLTRSILAENSPYYEAGVKLSYISDKRRWYIAALLLNGWQRIQIVKGNSLPSFGTQVTFSPRSRIKLNSSSFIGTDKPDSLRLMRYFHNFFVEMKLSSRSALILGLDAGAEEKDVDQNGVNIWYSPVTIFRYKFSEKTFASIRAEYYSDRHNVIVATGSPNGFDVASASANVDYYIMENVLWRTEARLFRSSDRIFPEDAGLMRTNSFVASSLSISF
jgi:hypothetical protein